MRYILSSKNIPINFQTNYHPSCFHTQTRSPLASCHTLGWHTHDHVHDHVTTAAGYVYYRHGVRQLLSCGRRRIFSDVPLTTASPMRRTSSGDCTNRAWEYPSILWQPSRTFWRRPTLGLSILPQVRETQWTTIFLYCRPGVLL